MFRLTFLGHQGWLCSTASTHVLIDPLLTEAFGHGGHVGAIYPPRIIDLAACPPIDAVFLTHEHDDHFDIPSLQRLDRTIPIFFSGRSSGAAWDLLARMGFAVAPLWPGQPVDVGDLRYHPLEIDGPVGDEGDVMPFVLADRGGHGSVFASVDVPLTDAVVQQASRLNVRPGVWAYANNTTLPAFGTTQSDDTCVLARIVTRRLQAIERLWARPHATVICGTGWSFPPPRAWLNRRVFGVDNARLAAAVDAPAVTAAIPGHMITMRDGALDGVETNAVSDFIASQPREQWPDRWLGSPDPARDIVPVYPSAGQPLAPERLDDFAGFLYGTPVFAAAQRGLNVGFRLRGPEQTLRYEPERCRFVESRGALASGYVCGSADLGAFLNGRLAPSALCNTGRMRTWNDRSELLRVSVHDLWTYGQPLRRPAAFARLYQTLTDGEAPDVRIFSPHGRRRA